MPASGPWRPVPDGVDFTHELADTGSGFAYHYTKNVRLNPGRPELVIAHRLVNRGTKPIVGTVYNHNFLVLDGQTPGPDFVITAPFELKTDKPLDPAVAIISGREFRYAAPVPDTRARRGAVPGLRPHRGGLPLHD